MELKYQTVCKYARCQQQMIQVSMAAGFSRRLTDFEQQDWPAQCRNVSSSWAAALAQTYVSYFNAKCNQETLLLGSLRQFSLQLHTRD